MIGLMWCKGTNEEKADMFFNITKPMTPFDKSDQKQHISMLMNED